MLWAPPSFLLNSIFIFLKHSLRNSFSEGLHLVKRVCLCVDSSSFSCHSLQWTLRGATQTPIQNWGTHSLGCWEFSKLTGGSCQPFSGVRPQQSARFPCQPTSGDWCHRSARAEPTPFLWRGIPGSQSRPSLRLCCRPPLPSVQSCCHPFAGVVSKEFSRKLSPPSSDSVCLQRSQVKVVDVRGERRKEKPRWNFRLESLASWQPVRPPYWWQM